MKTYKLFSLKKENFQSISPSNHSLHNVRNSNHFRKINLSPYISSYTLANYLGDN